jgi:hypothetical protein
MQKSELRRIAPNCGLGSSEERQLAAWFSQWLIRKPAASHSCDVAKSDEGELHPKRINQALAIEFGHHGPNVTAAHPKVIRQIHCGYPSAFRLGNGHRTHSVQRDEGLTWSLIVGGGLRHNFNLWSSQCCSQVHPLHFDK